MQQMEFIMQKVKLHDICTLERGSSPRPIQDYITTAKDGVNWIKIGDTNPNEKYVNKTAEKITKEGAKKSRKVEIGDFILSNSMSLGHPFIMNINGYIHDGWFVLRPDYKKVNRDFLYYSLLSDYVQTQFKGTCTGSVVKNIRSELVNDLDIFLPDITEQKRISKVLSTIDRKISVNREINRNLEELAKQIYDYWFVQFDFPNEEGMPYKSSGGKMVWNETLKREIPAGWKNGVLSNIAYITMGQSPEGSSYNEDGIGTIFYQGSTDFGIRFPNVRMYTTKPTRFAKIGDILMSVRAPVGAMNIANSDCCIGRGLSAMNSKIGSITHLYYTMDYFRHTFENKNAVGTTFGSITKDELYNLPVVIPSKEVISAFNVKTIYIFNQQLSTSKEIQELTALRDSLLPLLMNGQVTLNSCLSAD